MSERHGTPGGGTGHADRDDGRLGIGGRSAHGNPNRGAVMHCPYCGGDDLWPDYETDYAWRCTECCRVFTVKLHGHVPRDLAPADRRHVEVGA